MKTGEKVRNLRKQYNWTQEELGNRTGYSKQYISEIERGFKDCYQLLRQLSQALQSPCRDLLDDEEL